MASKDQNSIDGQETRAEKLDRAMAIFLESVHKPDHNLRGCAHNQKCYHELMQIREHVLEYLHTMKDSEFYREWTAE